MKGNHLALLPLSSPETSPTGPKNLARGHEGAGKFAGKTFRPLFAILRASVLPRKLRSLSKLSFPWVFSALPPRLRVSASNGIRPAHTEVAR